jgi:hypothetical protein
MESRIVPSFGAKGERLLLLASGKKLELAHLPAPEKQREISVGPGPELGDGTRAGRRVVRLHTA